jgi:hypothetical protein
MELEWWRRAPELADDCLRRPPSGDTPTWYRFAEGWLSLKSDDAPLLRRFQEIYPEGSGPFGGDSANPVVDCEVRVHPDAPVAVVRFADPEPLDSFAFCQALFPDRGYVEGPPGAGGWRTIASRQDELKPQVALSENLALVDRRQTWQPFIANYAVNRVLRLQRDMLFFHAGSIGIDGRGLMMVGPKASGKTTTSMTLASRGHSFLGDEMAAVNRATKAMLPFRRAVSIRKGPRAQRLDDHLSDHSYPEQTFPDGGQRVLVNVSDVFPDARPAPTTLTTVLFLQSFEERPRAVPFAFGLEHFQMLSPLACSMWGKAAGARMMDLTRLLRGVSCYFVHPGQPEQTADLVEEIVSGRFVQ